jgi:hypothetical protein
MTRTPWSRALAGALLTVLIGSFAVAPALAETPVPSVPTVIWTSEIADGATYAYGQVPAAPTCVAVEGDCIVAGYKTTVGAQELVPMVGTPAVAGIPTIKYTVTATWSLKGFAKPVRMSSVNKVKGGSTVPFKFKVYEAAGVKAKDKAVVAAFGAVLVSCTDHTVVAGTAAIDFLTATRHGFTLKYRHGAFHQNWKTPKATKVTVPANKGKAKGKAKTKKVVVPVCYQVTMSTVDGQSLSALFQLK